jgi:hypothetical protein
MEIGCAGEPFLGKEKWTVHLLVGNSSNNALFQRILNVRSFSRWVFSSPCAYIVSIDLPMKVKRSFVAENFLLTETFFLLMLLHFGT